MNTPTIALIVKIHFSPAPLALLFFHSLPPASFTDQGLYVHSVDYDPAKSDGQLRPNDEIIKVGGYNV